MTKERFAMAEHLMRALEELAESEHACKALVDRAYLRIDSGRTRRDEVKGRH